MNRLSGKRAVVTGAGSGIGRASAQRLAAEGAQVLAVGRSQDNIDETVMLIRADGGGSILVTSSIASLRANAGAISYSASKAALNNLVQCAANALSGTGVRVNAILPGLIETKMTRFMFEQARARGVEGKIGQVNPLKRAGQAHEIAAAVAFLASDDGSYVNGQAFAVDGGVSSTHPFGRIALER
jgi:NAD(P)-dependent dehydrogenase (short-subunit alcohol dehydrogenase family)